MVTLGNGFAVITRSNGTHGKCISKGGLAVRQAYPRGVSLQLHLTGAPTIRRQFMAIRVMIDTDDLSALDKDCELLATYSDLVHDLPLLEASFPDSRIILIDRGLGDPSGKASVADVETGALKIADVPAWLDRKEAEGIEFRTIYQNRAEAAQIDAAAGHRSFYRWVATLDGTAFVSRFKALHGPAAVQILPSSKLGVHADLSLVFEDGWNPTRTSLKRAVLRREVNAAISSVSSASSELHRVASLI